MSSAKVYNLKSFAKINLGIEILSRRADGYHNIKTIFQTINLYDLLKIKILKEKTFLLYGSCPQVSWDETNTIYKVYLLLKNYIPDNIGFDVFVEKNIPPGSGLAGGSGNAAVFLLFLNEFLGLKLSLNSLHKLAVKIGADVPFFLFGGTSLAQGVGDLLCPLDDLPAKNLLLVIPDIAVSTARVYSKFSLTKTINRSKIDIFLSSEKFSILENDLEKVTLKMYKKIAGLKAELLQAGFDAVLMSGSGSAVFGIAKNKTRFRTSVSKFFENRSLKNGDLKIVQSCFLKRSDYLNKIGVWPSGKASVFGAEIRRFESSHPRKDTDG